MSYLYNALEKKYKSVRGGVRVGEEVVFSVYAKSKLASTCNFIYYKTEGEKIEISMPYSDGKFSVGITFVERGLYYYYFSIGDTEYGRDEYYSLKLGSPSFFQLTVCDADFLTPDYYKGGIIYQIFPDRFCKVGETPVIECRHIELDWYKKPVYEANESGDVDNSYFYGGNFVGVISKLDYLLSLGINAIYFNPIFLSPSNHRYDTADYETVDPLLGGDEGLSLLLSECKKRGIRVIIDGVFNHTGDDSKYFNKYRRFGAGGAYNDKNSPYYDWYSFEEFPNVYRCWWDVPILPSINRDCPSFRNYISGEGGIVDKYLSLGVGGIRLDVVDELTNEFIREIKTAVKRNDKDAIIIGEVWEDASNKVAYDERKQYAMGDIDSAMNYPLRSAIISYVKSGDESVLATLLCEQINNYPKTFLDEQMNVLSTHDTSRLINELVFNNISDYSRSELKYVDFSFEKYQKGKEMLKIATLLQYTIYGIPTIYYGDEAGLTGFSDPYNRAAYPWEREDKDLIKWFIKLGELRNNCAALKGGELNILYRQNGLIVYERRTNSCVLTVAVNLGSYDYTLTFENSVYSFFTKEDEKLFLLKKGEFNALLSKE